MSGFFLIFIVIVLLLDIYIFQSVKTVFPSTAGISAIHIVYWLLSTTAYISFLLFFLLGKEGFHGWPRIILMGTALSFMVFKLVALPFLLVSDIIRIAEIFMVKVQSSAPEDGVKAISRSKFLNQVGLILGTGMFGAFIYGMVRGAYNIAVKRITIKIPGLPSQLSGLKIVQISDLHLGSFASVQPIENAVEIINKENADLFFFTGDLVNDRAEEAQAFVPVLQKIKAKLGKFSILGNHDYGNYIEWESQAAKQENLQQLVKTHAAAGWKILLDEHVTLKHNGIPLDILGVQYWGRSMGFGRIGNIEKAAAGASSALKLLLSHDPSHWDVVISQDERFKDIQVMFAGHTHGFQFGIEIPGFKWSPSQYVYPHWAGHYQQGEQHLYVNRGLGFLGYPGRVGIPPEITVMTIVSA